MMGIYLPEPSPTYPNGFPPGSWMIENVSAAHLVICLLGTVILEKLGEEHVRSGKPIIYTSADSVSRSRRTRM